MINHEFFLLVYEKYKNFFIWCKFCIAWLFYYVLYRGLSFERWMGCNCVISEEKLSVLQKCQFLRKMCNCVL